MPGEAEFARVAADLIGTADDLAAEVVEAARAQIAALDDDPGTLELLVASVHENLVSAIGFVQGRTRVDDLEAPSAALSYARTLAQRDVPLSALVRAYRIGHSQVLEHAFAQVEAIPLEHRADIVMTLVRRSQQFIDRIVEQVGRAYEVERERWVASQGGMRQQWVTDLLGGAALDVAEASAALGYPVEGTHVCVRLWPAHDLAATATSTAVAEAHQHLVAELRARASLLVPTDEREVRIWLATGSSRVVGIPRGIGLHATLSLPATGLAGFRRSAQQADLAYVVAASRPGPARWLRYPEVAPVALLARDRAALRDLVVHTLGDLAAPTERADMLRGTLRAFLACHRSYARTGAVENLHRNSVQYRVQQALGLLPTAALTDLHLGLALEAAHWLGTSVLRES